MVPAPSVAHARILSQVMEATAPRARLAGLIPAVGPFNLGESKRDFRVPDAGLLEPGASGVWLPTAALVVEIVSPDDETYAKLPFYAAHDIDEMLIVDPDSRAVDWLALAEGHYRPVDRSLLIDFGAAELARQIDWP